MVPESGIVRYKYKWEEGITIVGQMDGEKV